MGWDDLRLFLQVSRHRTLTAAAGKLKLSVATLGRRLDQLEHDLGLSLLLRTPQGVELTAQGRALLHHAKICDHRMADVERFAATMRQNPFGASLRISATEPVISEILAPQLAVLLHTNPQLRLDLRVENTQVSLALQDADLAIRLARPNGDSLMARRLKPLAMGLFGSRDLADKLDPDAIAKAPFIGYDDSYGRIAEVAWLEDCGLAQQVRIRTSSTRAMLNAAASGAGLAILPKVLAERHGDLAEVTPPAPVPERNIWVVWHRDANRNAALRISIAWIVQCFVSAARPAVTANDQPSRPNAGKVSSNQ